MEEMPLTHLGQVSETHLVTTAKWKPMYYYEAILNASLFSSFKQSPGEFEDEENVFRHYFSIIPSVSVTLVTTS